MDKNLPVTKTVDSSLEQAIGRIIRLRRLETEEKQSELAKATGLTQPVISALEKGGSLSISNLEKVAAHFGLKTSQIISMAEKLQTRPRLSVLTAAFLELNQKEEG